MSCNCGKKSVVVTSSTGKNVKQNVTTKRKGGTSRTTRRIIRTATH